MGKNRHHSTPNEPTAPPETPDDHASPEDVPAMPDDMPAPPETAPEASEIVRPSAGHLDWDRHDRDPNSPEGLDEQAARDLRAKQLAAITDPIPPRREPTLPAGVQMTGPGAEAMRTKAPPAAEPDPKKPPPGWKGGYRSCGNCGDFMGNDRFCKRCSPNRFDADGKCKIPSNVSMSTPPKYEA